jgi:hypothetical protein
MSANDNEELIDYEDDLTTAAAATSTQNGASADKDKKYAGIHSTGFR